VTDDRLDAVFSALADPTRRELVTRLLRDGPHTATALARELPMSRQAVVHHLQALEGAGLVDARRAGREVHWSATPAPLLDAAAWMAKASPRRGRREAPG
jgi:DNA-binding transcriptional ArsR family regulator